MTATLVSGASRYGGEVIFLVSRLTTTHAAGLGASVQPQACVLSNPESCSLSPHMFLHGVLSFHIFNLVIAQGFLLWFGFRYMFDILLIWKLPFRLLSTPSGCCIMFGAGWCKHRRRLRVILRRSAKHYVVSILILFLALDAGEFASSCFTMRFSLSHVGTLGLSDVTGLFLQTTWSAALLYGQ
jgi:hypothetical protein